MERPALLSAEVMGFLAMTSGYRVDLDFPPGQSHECTLLARWVPLAGSDHSVRVCLPEGGPENSPGEAERTPGRAFQS